MTTLGLSEPEKTGGKLLAKKGVDMATGTDFSRKLLAPRDWFYSDLFRQMMAKHFEKGTIAGVTIDRQVVTDWNLHD